MPRETKTPTFRLRTFNPVKERAALFAWAHDRLFQLGLQEKQNVGPGKTGFDGLTTLGRAVLRAADLLPVGGVQDQMDR